MPPAKRATTDPVSARGSSLGSLVLDNRLTVPLNQRPWEWQSHHLDDLFDDVISTADRWSEVLSDGKWHWRKNTDDLLPHFFGPVVVETVDAAEMSVVDGQQRLTATTILVSVLRDVVAPLREEPSPGPVKTQSRALETALNSWLLAEPAAGKSTPRLTLDETISEFFNGYVIDAVGADERAQFIDDHPVTAETEAEDVRRALQMATTHLGNRVLKHLADKCPDSSPTCVLSRVDVLLQTLRDAFQVVVIRVHRPGLSPQLFSGLNARGTGLTAADKVKNELFVPSPTAQHQDIKKQWDVMVRYAPDRDAETFLRLRHIARIDDVKQTELFHHVRAGEIQKSGPDTLGLVKDWAKDAELQRIAHGVTEHKNISDITRRHLLDIRSSRHTYARPLLLAAARRFLVGDPTSFAEAVLLTRNVAFRELTVGRLQAETFLSRIGPIARQLDLDGDLEKARSSLISMSSDALFKKNFSAHHENRAPQQYYILYELELAAGGPTGVVPAPHSPDYEKVRPSTNIEHILPKRISPTRKGEFASWRDPHDKSRIDPELKRDWLQRIGNLLLLENNINGDVSDYDYAAKRTGNYPGSAGIVSGGRQRLSYGDSKLVLPNELAASASPRTWTKSAIEKRQRALAELSVVAWRLEKAKPLKAAQKPTKRPTKKPAA